MDTPDTDWESVAKNLRQRLAQAQFERDQMRDFLKWMLANPQISKGLKAVIREAFRGYF